ncbi:MAG: SDR family oxidoreductase [Aeromicrobium sp.]|uniref:SDR family oxidoreductase n=1 Tax=Aeromicrobium sp. TaxID=1871063 RepID=UPI0039E6C99A
MRDADWEIFWCAGRGVTSTPKSDLQIEVDVFHRFLDDLVGGRSLLDPTKGRLFLASSVGAIYGGSSLPPFTEKTPPNPSSAYGEAKLAMEDLVRSISDSSGIRSFIGRITNLYGPAQDMSKGQGLISTVVASYITGHPVSIYVPLDTLRDYLYVDDCGRMVAAGMKKLADEPSGTSVVKILGSTMPWSIGAVLGEAARVHRLRAPIISGQGTAASVAGQAHDLRVRSLIWTDLDSLARTTLPAGLDSLHRARLANVMACGLPLS